MNFRFICKLIDQQNYLLGQDLAFDRLIQLGRMRVHNYGMRSKKLLFGFVHVDLDNIITFELKFLILETVLIFPISEYHLSLDFFSLLPSCYLFKF